MAFIEHKSGEWKPEKSGDSIEGVLINVQTNVGENKSNIYTIEKDQKPFEVWGSTVLDQRMIGIRLGDLIRIEYKGLGEPKPGRNPPKIFVVYKDDGFN